MTQAKRQSGFSLLELILVIVLLGVLAGGAGLLITRPIEAYNDQLRRQQLVDQGEMALRQIARDVRRALPNSIRINTSAIPGGWALEMVNTIDGARYRDEPGGLFLAASDWLDFSTADTDFNLLGQFHSLSASATAWPTNRRLVIYNTAPTDIYVDINSGSGAGIVSSAGTAITLSNNGIEHHIEMIPAFRFTQQSPGQRIFVIDGAISYACDPSTNNIIRYDNYAYQTVQQVTNAALAGLTNVQSGVVVSQLDSCEIRYAPGTTQRGSLVSLQINLADATGEGISLYHQVHVVNVP